MKSVAIALSGLLLLLSASMAQATQSQRGVVSPTDLRSAVRKGSNTTYFELLQMVFPDLQVDPTQPNAAVGHRTVPVKHVTENGEAAALEGNFAISDFEGRWIVSDGRPVLLLNLDLSADGANEGTPYAGEAALLAAFSVEPAARLIDLIDIKTDRFTGFWEKKPSFQLNSRNEAFVVSSTHWNAGENYTDLYLMFLDGKNFKVITNLLLLDTQGCGATVKESPHFRALPPVGRKYPSVSVSVKVTKEPDPKECERKTSVYTRQYQGVFYWNKTKAAYEGNSRQLKALDKFNRERL
jgi:hypothetical protein